MPKIAVNGVNITYEILGEGVPVVFTPGGWATPKETMRWMAGRMSLEYKTLIYDRRNCGESDVLFEDAPSEFHLFADDLHTLLVNLGMVPAYLCGGSGGLLTSLLMAYRYPESVRGLLFDSVPTDSPEFWQAVAHGYYLETAVLAERKGMEAVRTFSNDYEDWSKRFKQNPNGREQFLSLDPVAFATTLRRWSEWCTSGRAHLGGLPDEELSSITVPTMIVPGIDDFHPRHTSAELHRLLPNSEFFSREDFFTPAEIANLGELAANWIDGRYMAFYAPYFDKFIKKMES